jgi:hypothetical protein
MFLIDASSKNSFSLFRLQNEERKDMLRARQNQIEQLGLDLIKDQVIERYNIAYSERFHGRKIIFIKKKHI